MLTRIEVDGFKNLFNVNVDFGPYTCIAGANAVGKSNLFDAIEFLSILASESFLDATQTLRVAGDKIGDPRTLFWLDEIGTQEKMKLAVEMIIDPEVEDEFGEPAKATNVFLRYEVELAYEGPTGKLGGRFGSVHLVRESLTRIKKDDAKRKLKWVNNKSFIDEMYRGRTRTKPYISTEKGTTGNTVFQIHQDGGSRGQPRKMPSERTKRTVLATINSSDDPTILAAKREMQSWRKLALEPSSMRSPDSSSTKSVVGSDGARLAATLTRLLDTDENVLARVASTTSGLADVREVMVDYDEARDSFVLMAKLGSGPFLPARALSEGTLRFLALSIIEADDDFGGVICMEEPENGIHPAKIPSVVALLRDLTVDIEEPIGPDNPLRQVIVNTHSPHFVIEQNPEDLLLAMPISLKRNNREILSLRLAPIAGTWRDVGGSPNASKTMITDYLTLPEEAPMQLSELEIASVREARN